VREKDNEGHRYGRACVGELCVRVKVCVCERACEKEWVCVCEREREGERARESRDSMRVR